MKVSELPIHIKVRGLRREWEQKERKRSGKNQDATCVCTNSP